MAEIDEKKKLEKLVEAMKKLIAPKPSSGGSNSGKEQHKTGAKA